MTGARTTLKKICKKGCIVLIKNDMYTRPVVELFLLPGRYYTIIVVVDQLRMSLSR